MGKYQPLSWSRCRYRPYPPARNGKRHLSLTWETSNKKQCQNSWRLKSTIANVAKKQTIRIWERCPSYSAETLNLLIGRTSIEWSSQISRHQQAFWKRSRFNYILNNNKLPSAVPSRKTNMSMKYLETYIFKSGSSFQPARLLVIGTLGVFQFVLLPVSQSSGHPSAALTWRLQLHLELPVVRRRNPDAPHSLCPAHWRPRPTKPTAVLTVKTRETRRVLLMRFHRQGLIQRLFKTSRLNTRGSSQGWFYDAKETPGRKFIILLKYLE